MSLLTRVELLTSSSEVIIIERALSIEILFRISIEKLKNTSY